MPSNDKFLKEKNMLKYLPLIGLVFLLSCSETGCKRDQDILSRKIMIEVLADLHLAEGVASSRGFAANNPRMDTLDFYSPIFEKHGISREQFEKSIRHFTSLPGEFDKIYEEVIEKMTRKSVVVDELLIEEARDVLGNLWNQKRAWKFPADTSNRIKVDIPLEQTGTYTFSAQIRLSQEDYATDSRVSLWFWRQDSTGTEYRDSFPVLTLKNDGKLHAYRVSKFLGDTLMTHLRGWILDHAHPDTTARRNADVFRIRIFIEEEAPDEEELIRMSRDLPIDE
jgi:hypothetical protein